MPFLDCFGAARLAMTVASMYNRQYLIEGKTRFLSRSVHLPEASAAIAARLVQAGLL
jgi:hypothetical protein